MAVLSALVKRVTLKVKTQSKKVNKSWLNDHVNDPYVKLAKKDGYRARAAYKLKEIDEQLGLIKPGNLVVDLGSAPGAWSQYVRRRLSPEGAAVGALNGAIVAVDILPMEPVEGVLFIHGDFREPSVLAEVETALQGRMADVVVSDMAPNISGIAASDQARHAHLCELALEFALDHLRPEGAFLVKAFQGSGFQEFHASLKQSFTQVSSRKPLASRERSPEMYLLARGLRRG